MPKSCGSGQALTLTTEQLDSIMREASPKLRAVFQICRCTACRVSESLSLLWANVTATDIIFPKSVTKGKLKTRTIPMNGRLAEALRAWRSAWTTAQGREPEKTDFLFPSATGTATHFTRKSVDRGLRQICARLGIEGASTHSFRRSSITSASNAGVPVRHIQLLSGHSSLEMVQRYCDVSESQKRNATNAFA